jgi:hypothetical protein
MNSRADRINRIAAILKLQYRISEWKLIQLRQREKELQDREAYLIEALNDEQPLKDVSSEVIARRLTTTSVSARGVHALAEDQLDRLRAEARRLKAMERVAVSAAGAERRDAEKRSLEELTDALTGGSVGQAKFRWS